MDRILLHFFLFNSAPTTPLIRDPTGSPDLLSKTQALSSKRTTEPSRRWVGYLVRTTTACRTSPRLTLAAAEMPAIPEEDAPLCSWTTTTIRSPVMVRWCPDGRRDRNIGRRRAYRCGHVAFVQRPRRIRRGQRPSCRCS